MDYKSINDSNKFFVKIKFTRTKSIYGKKARHNVNT